MEHDGTSAGLFKDSCHHILGSCPSSGLSNLQSDVRRLMTPLRRFKRSGTSRHTFLRFPRGLYIRTGLSAAAATPRGHCAVMGARRVRITCYDRVMGYGVKIPTYQHGISKIVWLVAEYGLYHV